MAAIYRGIVRVQRWLQSQLPSQERQDNLILLVGTLAAGGIVIIRCTVGLPA